MRANDCGNGESVIIYGAEAWAAGLFGMAGIASAVLGKLADATSILFVVKVCSFLPLMGLLTAFLPDLKNYDQETAPTE